MYPSDQTSYNNMPVYTVEMNGSYLDYNDSEQVYEYVREVVKYKSDLEYKVKNYNVNNKISENMLKNISADKSNNIYPKDTHKKPSIVYGMITAREFARYVPVTQNGVYY